jgi:hypothetical protein
MIAGLPGTGISGLFYLLSAFWMPIAEIARFLSGRKRQSNWKLVFLQFALATGIFAALGVTGALIDYFIPISVKFFEAFIPNSDKTSQTISLGVAPTVITIAVLFLFLFSLEIIGIILGLINSRNPQKSLKKEAITVKHLFPEKRKAIEETRG